LKFKSNKNIEFFVDKKIQEQIIESYALLVGSKKNVLVIEKNEEINKNLEKNMCNVTDINFNINNLEGETFEDTDNFTLGTINFKKLEGKKFDVILVQNILLTLKPKQFLKKLSSILTENGYIVCSMPNVANMKNRISFLNGNLNLDEFGINTGMNFLTLPNIIIMLSEINFSISKLLRVKQNFFAQKIDAKDYGFPIELVEAVLAQPESETHTFIFKINSENSIRPTLRKWLSTFDYNGVTNDLRDILIQNKDDIARLEGTIKDKDEYIEQVIRDKDEYIEQVIRDKDEFFEKAVKEKDDLIHNLEKETKDQKPKKKRSFFR
tara:strand:- start:377 stop:1345 length:969 start_codon:yes stop_codon:yes gene_type:complete